MKGLPLGLSTKRLNNILLVILMRKNKYGVAPKEQRTSRDGIVFASKAEMIRWEKLLLWQIAGEIRNLRRQVKYPLTINGVRVGDYLSDFNYEKKKPDGTWIEIVEDIKGKDTPVSILKRKIVWAIYKIDVKTLRG